VLICFLIKSVWNVPNKIDFTFNLSLLFDFFIKVNCRQTMDVYQCQSIACNGSNI